MEIRPFIENDAKSVYEVHRRAFDGRTGEARIVRRLHDSEKAVVSLVAVEHEVIVGHVLFSPTCVENHVGTIRLVGLAPISVLPNHQNQGVGSSLIERGLVDCHEAGADAVVVLGDPKYYSRFGFERAGMYGLENEYGADEEFMVNPLTDRVIERVSGLVKYRPEFHESET